MRCPTPIRIATDIQQTEDEKMLVPCGRCVFCLEQKRAEWTYRIMQELKNSYSAYFLTLTYDDEHVPIGEYNATLHKKDVQDFLKRLRKKQDYILTNSEIMLKTTFKQKIRYYLVGEYGAKTLRPHYHTIIFNIIPQVINEIEKIWKNGHIAIGTVTQSSIHYTTKYMINKEMTVPGTEKPFALMSRRPGIGAGYLDSHSKYHKESQVDYVRSNGYIQKMPRYYKYKIFTKDEINTYSKKNQERLVNTELREIKRIENLGNKYYSYIDNSVDTKRKNITLKIQKNSKL